MEDSKIPIKEFQTLKTAISSYYRGYRYKWLRCCLYGIVPRAELDRTNIGAYLFHVLAFHGEISPTNVGLLSEITELTCVQGAKDCLNKYKQDNKCKSSKAKILTPYRRGLVKALMNAGKEEFENVVGNYEELKPYEYKDIWDAVFKLEKATLLEDNSEKIQYFVNLLEKSTKELFLGEIAAAGAQGTLPGVLTSSLSTANQPGTSSVLPSLSSMSPANQPGTSFVLSSAANQPGTSSGPSTSPLSPANQQGSSSGPSISSTFPVTQQLTTSSASSMSSSQQASGIFSLYYTYNEEIRKYLLERQKAICANYNRFTPPIMQSRFQLDIAHMFTDLNLLKENNMRHQQDATPITLDDVLDIIKNKPACKMLIEGEGGIGKTTLLSYLANKWSTEISDKHFKGKIVFFVNIRDLGEGEDILDIIVKQIKLRDFNRKTDLPKDVKLIEKFIMNHDDEIVLMLDGLDELKTGSESPISIFEKKEFKRSAVILTSRSENINEFIKKSDVHVKVKGFNEKKVGEYIKKYFKSDSRLGETLITKLSSRDHPELWSMCRNPMMLLLICIMWEEKQEIPSIKADLFREIFRCILNQYNKVQSKLKISTFEDIQKPYVNAMCLLGRCMYHGLKKNQLSISKTDLVGNENMIAIALKLGFVYKDETFQQTNFEEIYAASHKLIVESLVGFYLYKICENTIDMPDNLSLDVKEWEEIRENDGLQNAREFAIGFLGRNADKFLKNCITNSLDTLRTVIFIYMNYVKQEDMTSVLKSVTEYMISSNLEIKQYISDIHRSLKIFLNYLNPHVDVNKDILYLMRKIYDTVDIDSIEIQSFTNAMSSKERGKILAHILLAVRNQDIFLKKVNKELNEKEEEYFLAECEKINIKLDFFSYEIDAPITALFLVYLLTHSIFLYTFNIEGKWNLRNILNETIKMIPIGTILKLSEICITHCNLSNSDGTSLASLISICPELDSIYLIDCNLTGDVIHDMLRDGIKFQNSELSTLNISDNNLSNIDGNSLALLFDIFPNLDSFYINECNLTGNVINDMIKNCSSRGIKLKLWHFDIGGNDLSNIDGALLASLMKISPHLEILYMNDCILTGHVINCMVKECRSIKFPLLELCIDENNLSRIDYTSLTFLIFSNLKLLSLANCNLTGDIISGMITDCYRKGMKSKLRCLHINDNNLNNIDGRSLALLMDLPDLLKMCNCNLTGDIINDMIRECSSRRIKSELKDLDISDNNLRNIDPTSLSSLMSIYPKLEIIKMCNCNLTGDIINDMIRECSSRRIKSELKDLDISDNNLRNIDPTSLSSLMHIYPKLLRIYMRNCNLTGDIMNDMIRECSSRRIKSELEDLNISDNNFSNIDPTSLSSLMDIYPKLDQIDMRNCNVNKDVIIDMTENFSSKGFRVSVQV